MNMTHLSALIQSVSCGKRGRLRISSQWDWGKLLYLFGLVAADGAVYENHDQHSYYVMFSNEEPVLLGAFEEAAEDLFPGVTIQRHLNQDGVTMLRINSLALVRLAKGLGIDADFTHVMRLPDDLVAAFLRGYFDGLLLDQSRSAGAAASAVAATNRPGRGSAQSNHA
ncbi:MAG: hypothetical protein AUI83_26155 [Armatimonadetes bacterium 13_1_40CM_3_65_7]|nr:MAG: hypothetical protein AUI83_26155 [Armatimonadetes bacterium 13_1_40CM_3_65_7]